MSKAKIVLMLFAVCLTGSRLHAQGMKDPTTWRYEAKRKYGNHFDIFFYVKLADKWHVYALDPGGDESMIAPTFTVSQAKNIKVIGKVREMTRPLETHIEGVDGPVHYFEKEAVFVQEVEVAGNAPLIVKGNHEYQVCNDHMCLPPKTLAFSVRIRP